MPNSPNYRFGDFMLDVSNRQLWRGESRVDLNARYFDALALLVREHGQLVEKERFFEEVWGDVVVSDSALTQCIKDIRKHLGDDAANPRHIATVPRYGYRFIGTVETVPFGGDAADDSMRHEHTPTISAPPPSTGIRTAPSILTALSVVAAGAVGGGAAGFLGGLIYGFGLAYQAADAGTGAASVLLVLISLSVLVGLMGGFGVSVGIAAARAAGLKHAAWSIAGAAVGGMIVGGVAKLLGVDAFNLLVGRAPAGITGGFEGALLGAALASGAHIWGGFDAVPRWRPVAGGAIAGAVAGVLIPLLGGRLMGGSLDLLAHSFSDSKLHVDALGRFFGEMHFGATSQVVLGGLEGLLFGSCVVAALVIAARQSPR